MCLAQPDQEPIKGWSRTERTDWSWALPGTRFGIIGFSNETWNWEIGYWLLVVFVFSSLRRWAGEWTAALSLTSHTWLKWVFRFQTLFLESFFSSALELHLSHGPSPSPQRRRLVTMKPRGSQAFCLVSLWGRSFSQAEATLAPGSWCPCFSWPWSCHSTGRKLTRFPVECGSREGREIKP